MVEYEDREPDADRENSEESARVVKVLPSLAGEKVVRVRTHEGRRGKAVVTKISRKSAKPIG